MQEKSFNQFMTEVANRFDELSEEEQDVIRSLRGTDQGTVLAKVLGPELASVDLGVSSVSPTPAVQQQMQRAGLGSR